MRLSDIGEFGLIDQLKSKLPVPDKSVVVGIGDDAAVVAYPEGHQVVVTTDMLVDGVHFRDDTISKHDLGWKSLAASISDIAAMGGIPKHALVSLAIPPHMEIGSLTQIYEGMAEIGQHYQVDVVGGDIVKTTDQLVISVTMMGQVRNGKSLLRSGARPGDCVFVSGWVGGSAAGLSWLESSQKVLLPPDEAEVLTSCHQRPQPQVALGSHLADAGICSSCNDVSDGLASELNEIAKASSVGIRIEAARMPIHPATGHWARICGRDPLDWALYGGEDYQLVGTIDQLGYANIAAWGERTGNRITLIGQVTNGVGVHLQRADGSMQELSAKGYNHFSEVESSELE